MFETTYTQQGNHLWIKFFLLDDSVSLNDWGVTRQALLNDLQTFVGKPFIIMPSFGHPTPARGEDMFKEQEPYKVGTIKETGIDTRTNKAWAVAEITDQEAIKLIKAGTVKFVSPSIVFHNHQLTHDADMKEIITGFEAAHVAGVKDPAFGMSKAMIKGQCTGDAATCKTQLRTVQASISPCGNIMTWKDEGIKSATNSIKSLNDNAINNMSQQTDKNPTEQIEELKTALAELKKKVADMAVDDEEDTEDQSKTKTKKAKNAETVDTQGENDYDNDNINENVDSMGTNKQVKKKASPKQDASETVAAEVKQLKSEIAMITKKPIIDGILQAKTDLGLITGETRSVEATKLATLPLEDLEQVSAEFTKLANANKTPYVRYNSASVNSGENGQKKFADSFIQEVIL